MTVASVENAPAKINLALHVTGRRADGYHLLDTLVVFARAGDRVSVSPAKKDDFTISGPFAGNLDAGGDNLVTRARDLLRKMAGESSPVSIALEKNLPIASGLGGGSSDAAATLRALARLWRVGLSETALAQTALRLGADLPMCLAARPLFARGIGEEMEDADGIPEMALVLVNPGVTVSTPSIFAALRSPEHPPLPALPVRRDFQTLAAWLHTTRNDLQAPAIAHAPRIADVLEALHGSGAAFARMSGSGATCFGLFASDADAVRAAAGIAAARPSWYVTATTTTEKARADAAP